MTTNEKHFYVPQSCIANIVNADFGIYKLSDLPSFHKPGQEAIDFTERLLDEVVKAGEVELVFSDEKPSHTWVMTDAERVSGRLAAIIGPPGLEQMLGGRHEEVSSWLWDQGELEHVLHRNLIERE